MRFSIYILIYGLVLFNFPGCLSSDINDTGVKTEDVASFIDNIKNENNDALKKGALASLGQKVEELIKGTITDSAQIKAALKAEVDKLAKTSPSIQEQRENLIQEAAQYITKKQSKDTSTGAPTTTTVSGGQGAGDTSNNTSASAAGAGAGGAGTPAASDAAGAGNTSKNTAAGTGGGNTNTGSGGSSS